MLGLRVRRRILDSHRRTALVGTLAPNFHLDGDSDDDQADSISESESKCSKQWYELDGQEQEALISLRDARKTLQHATKSRRFYPKSGSRARSTGKFIDELKKVTPCNRCGATCHWEEDCTQPARSRKKRSPSAKGKGRSRRSRRGKSDGKGRGGSSNYPIVEVYNDGSKTQTSHTGCFVRIGALVFEKVLSGETGGLTRRNTFTETVFRWIGPHDFYRENCDFCSS